jgi:DNA polymerase III, delta subunit (EC 2.7.7.7)
MAPAPRRSSGPAAKSSIPQLSWRSPQPAPIVLVSGPEDVCAERAIAGVRDYLRAEDASLEVSDIRADDYASGTLLGLTSPSLFGEPRLVRVTGVEKCSDAFLAEALAYLDNPQEGATVILRHTGASVRGKKLLDAVRAGTGEASR